MTIVTRIGSRIVVRLWGIPGDSPYAVDADEKLKQIIFFKVKSVKIRQM